VSSLQGRILGILATVALFLAVTLWFNGYRNTPPPPKGAPAAASRPPEDGDPLSPRLFDQSRSIRIHVAGAVKKPGVYTVPSWARVTDAVRKAGGATTNANLDAINLADFLKDGEQLRIPIRGGRERLASHLPSPEPAAPPPTIGGRGLGRHPFVTAAAGSAAASGGAAPINLNTATREELEGLPGVGAVTAEKIVSYRQTNGPFLQTEDLLNVRGIGEKKFEKLQPLVAVR